MVWNAWSGTGERRTGITPSRYAKAIREEMRRKAKRWAGDIKTAMRAYPGVISVINFAIEEELAIGGATSGLFGILSVVEHLFGEDFL